jgi:seryl-tRNA synthetase
MHCVQLKFSALLLLTVCLAAVVMFVYYLHCFQRQLFRQRKADLLAHAQQRCTVFQRIRTSKVWKTLLAEQGESVLHYFQALKNDPNQNSHMTHNANSNTSKRDKSTDQVSALIWVASKHIQNLAHELAEGEVELTQTLLSMPDASADQVLLLRHDQAEATSVASVGSDAPDVQATSATSYVSIVDSEIDTGAHAHEEKPPAAGAEEQAKFEAMAQMNVNRKMLETDVIDLMYRYTHELK